MPWSLSLVISFSLFLATILLACMITIVLSLIPASAKYLVSLLFRNWINFLALSGLSSNSAFKASMSFLVSLANVIYPRRKRKYAQFYVITLSILSKKVCLTPFNIDLLGCFFLRASSSIFNVTSLHRNPK